MKFFSRWRRARPTTATPTPKVDPEPLDPEQAPAKPRSVSRGRRPATMGKSSAEQAYLAEAALRAKQDG